MGSQAGAWEPEILKIFPRHDTRGKFLRLISIMRKIIKKGRSQAGSE
jgi:hypothetical protein